MLRCLAIASVCVAAMAQPTAPSFEKASIQPTQHGRLPGGKSESSIDVGTPLTFRAENKSLAGLIEFAYSVQAYQVTGPPWLTDSAVAFDVDAKAPAGTSQALLPLMLQKLLADRFHLQIHRESREVEVYQLLAGSGASKLEPSKSDGQRSTTTAVGGQITAAHASMQVLAIWLSGELRRPVLDKTGIKGDFDFILDYDLNEGGQKPYIFDAMPDQLGLRLENAKANIEMVVVDRVERGSSDK